MANNLIQNERETGMLRVIPVNEIMESMKNEPDPDPLFESLWFEGELACLFADSNVGKSILAVQIAESIAGSQPVLYVDCELTDKQFQRRYSSPDSGASHYFPVGFLRATIDPQKIGSGNFEDCLIKDIEKAVCLYDCKVIILDNLTYACNTSEKGDAAGVFMMNLKKLQMKYGWSILVIAHTPKRDEKTPITSNHLAGSKKLFNFFDSVFAIGKSKEDESYRYLKQLKVRSGEFVYTEDNVAVYELEKSEDGNLFFRFRKLDSEIEQLEPFFDYTDAEHYDEVVRLHDSGSSFREIATKCGISKSRAQRIYKRHQERKKMALERANSLVIESDNDCTENENVAEGDYLVALFDESDCPVVSNPRGTGRWDRDDF